MDKDGDGFINTFDLLTVMQHLGSKISESEAQEMIHEVDEDGKGTINFDEFLKMMAQKAKNKDDEHEDIKEAFKAFDKNEDGFISVDEMKDVLLSYGLEMAKDDIEEMFTTVDIDKDGKLNFDEFQELMKDFSLIKAAKSEG